MRDVGFHPNNAACTVRGRRNSGIRKLFALGTHNLFSTNRLSAEIDQQEAQLLRRTYLWLPLALLAAALPFGIAWWAGGAGDDDGRRMRIRLASAILLLIGIALTAWTVLGLFLPYAGMLEKLTNLR